MILQAKVTRCMDLRGASPSVTCTLDREAQGTAWMALTRFNASVLGPLERPALAWMAERMPAWVMPDHLTMLGVAGALLTGAGFILSRWSLQWLWLANVGLVVNWIGDSVDGTLARLSAHRAAALRLLRGSHERLVFPGHHLSLARILALCHFSVACLGLIAFLMGFVYTLIGAHVRATMRITYFGFGPTEIRALLLFGNLMALAFGFVYLAADCGLGAVRSDLDA